MQSDATPPLEQCLDAQGYVLIPGVLDARACAGLAALAHHAAAAAPRDLLAQPWCSALADRLLAHPGLRELVPAGHVAVQCTCFEKSTGHNWLVAWHQDLSIPVAQRVSAPGWSGWSVKDGQLFAQPPAAVLQDLLAVRVHLDTCGTDDGSLRLVPGSHRHGFVTGPQAAGLRAAYGEAAALAPQGAALLMRPLLLHASSKASGASRRRVLHFVFGPRSLPDGLQWPAARAGKPVACAAEA